MAESLPFEVADLDGTLVFGRRLAELLFPGAVLALVGPLGAGKTQLVRAIAEGLGISPSYVNLIERNQRPVTAQILLRLAESYDLDLRDLATADEDRFFAELNEVFSDPLFRQIDLPKQELRDLAELCPGVTHALQRLYAAYTEARRGETCSGSPPSKAWRSGSSRARSARERLCSPSISPAPVA